MYRTIFAQDLSKARRCAHAGWICWIGEAEIMARPANRIEHGLVRWQEAVPVWPAVIVGAAILILASELKRFRCVVGRSGTALVGAVFADEQSAAKGMIFWREANCVAVAVSP